MDSLVNDGVAIAGSPLARLMSAAIPDASICIVYAGDVMDCCAHSQHDVVLALLSQIDGKKPSDEVRLSADDIRTLNADLCGRTQHAVVEQETIEPIEQPSKKKKN